MIPFKYYRFVFSFIMAGVMSFVISGALVFINLGLIDDFLKVWLISWGKAFVIAFPCVIVVAPLAAKLASIISPNPQKKG